MTSLHLSGCFKIYVYYLRLARVELVLPLALSLILSTILQ